MFFKFDQCLCVVVAIFICLKFIYQTCFEIFTFIRYASLNPFLFFTFLLLVVDFFALIFFLMLLFL